MLTFILIFLFSMSIIVYILYFTRTLHTSIKIMYSVLILAFGFISGIAIAGRVPIVYHESIYSEELRLIDSTHYIEVYTNEIVPVYLFQPLSEPATRYSASPIEKTNLIFTNETPTVYIYTYEFDQSSIQNLFSIKKINIESKYSLHIPLNSIKYP